MAYKVARSLVQQISEPFPNLQTHLHFVNMLNVFVLKVLSLRYNGFAIFHFVYSLPGCDGSVSSPEAIDCGHPPGGTRRGYHKVSPVRLHFSHLSSQFVVVTSRFSVLVVDLFHKRR